VLRLQRNQPIERCVSELLSLFESFLQHEAVSIARRRVQKVSALA
jgi:hypothetical protein